MVKCFDTLKSSIIAEAFLVMSMKIKFSLNVASILNFNFVAS
jgi:hypothetical protein